MSTSSAELGVRMHVRIRTELAVGADLHAFQMRERLHHAYPRRSCNR
jgi:hypothetical protein